MSKTGPDVDKGWKCVLDAEASGYRLPSEAQWEYACRAGSHTQYAFGDDERLLPEYGYYVSNSKQQTWPAGGKLPNGWGLFDMHGNVMEWCQDWWDDRYYACFAKSPAIDPQGPSGGGLRVFRGGGLRGGADYCRAAYRLSVIGRQPVVDRGFRVAAVPQGQSFPGPDRAERKARQP